ncbi:ABC transporter substrate-binding protein [Fundicoccus sp. Sow4_D5]|uniref:ABC transporter substrate-binding protein n=1 Tax=Fundicoccus sp. Sow4_D5 TaxID=3438782 RepID=UPI003F8F625E
MKKMFNLLVQSVITLSLLFSISQVTLVSAVAENDSVDFILDWVPNTNHTGLYVAVEKGYFTEAGVDVTIRRPPEGSTTELVGLGQAEFGISFQDSIASRFAGGLPVTAVAAILEHNTSGVISNEAAEIKAPQDLTDKSYGTWNDPIELAMIQFLVNQEGGNYEAVKLVPNQADNSVVGLANEMFDSAWIYYAWDGIMADYQEVASNFFYFADYAEALDFYSPIIIANNDYLSQQGDQATKVIQAIKKGYQYAMEHPEESAEILIKNAPELESQKDMVLASQIWISEQYAEEPSQWGHIDESRWNQFYKWLYENDLVEVDLTLGNYFTNEYLED